MPKRRLVLPVPAALLMLACGGASQPAKNEPAAPSTTSAPSQEAPSLDYFVGTWSGEFRGTQAFAKLDVAADGRFTFDVTFGPEPDQRCNVSGVLTVASEQLDFKVETPPPCHGTAETKLGKQKLLKSDQRSFAIGDVEYLEAIQVDDAGEYSGPVWVFQRGA